MPVNIDQLKSWNESLVRPARVHRQPRIVSMFKEVLRAPIPLFHVVMNLKQKEYFEVIVSEKFRVREDRNKYLRLSRQLRRPWDVSEITPAHARAWIRVGAGNEQRVVPAVMRWEELGKLAISLGMEMADVGNYKLAIDRAGRLFSTKRLKDEKSISNEEIRKMIFGYINGRTDEKPPVLYADPFKDFMGKWCVLLCNDEEGKNVLMSIDRLGQEVPYMFVGLTFESREKINVQIFKRTICGFRDARIISQPTPGLKESHDGESVKEIAGKTHKKTSKQRESKIVSNWINANNAKPIVVRRRVVNGKFITLCSIDGLPLLLTGLGYIRPQLRAVNILLKTEKIRGVMVQTARLFAVGRDPLKEPKGKSFAAYQIVRDSSHAKLLYLRKP